MMRDRGLLVVFAVALLLRLVYLQGWLNPLETRQTPIFGDAAGYYLSAVHLSGGNPVEVAAAKLDRLRNTPWGRQPTWTMLSVRGPGYPLFLAGSFWLFGEGPWPIRYVQALLGAVSCVLIFLLGRELADQRVGLIAGLLAAIHPTSILFTGRILTEGLSTFLFWFGLLAMVLGIRRRALSWIFLAGLGLALASLTRATLLSAVPFATVALVVGIRGVPLGRRVLSVAVFIGVLFSPLITWNVIARDAGADPIAGSRGVQVVAQTAREAGHPSVQGWKTDDKSSFVRRAAQRDPIRPTAIASLIFHHFWFVDHLWREVPAWLHSLQRVLVILALAGLGMSLVRWRDFAPVLFLIVPMAIASVKWIEIRPLLPFAPVLFLFAALFMSRILDASRSKSTRKRSLGWGLGGISLTVALLYATQMFNLTRALPSVSPITLGHLGDLITVALALPWGYFLYRTVTEDLGRKRALLVGTAPAVLFVALFGSYAYVASEPRWRAWSLDLTSLKESVVQQIELPRALAAEEIEAVLWLVDLQTTSDPPPVRVGVDGSWLSGDQFSWRRPFCDLDDRLPETRKGRRTCHVYRAISEFTGALQSSPQWWGIEMNADLVAGKQVLSLELARELPEDTEGRVIELGGTFSDGPPDIHTGPSLDAVTIGKRTSLYRWHVTNDWRLWDFNRLSSKGTKSEIRGTALEEGRPEFEDAHTRALAASMARGHARFNIRLLVDHRDGRRIVY